MKLFKRGIITKKQGKLTAANSAGAAGVGGRPPRKKEGRQDRDEKGDSWDRYTPKSEKLREEAFEDTVLAFLHQSLTVVSSETEGEDVSQVTKSNSQEASDMSITSTFDSVPKLGTYGSDLNVLSAEEVRKNSTEYRRKNEKRLRRMYNAACKDLKASRLSKSLEGFEEILFLLVSEFGEGHKRVATALHNLGIAHLRIGNLEEAADAIEEAIKIRKQKLGSYSPRVADSLVELGNTLLAQHEHEDSIEIFEEALAIREKMLTTLDHSEQGQVKLQMSKILNDIGCAHFEYAELDNAKEAFEEALAIQRACFEEGTFTSMPGFLAISNTVCNLALVHMEMADWESAVFRLEEGLKIQQNSLEHTNVIIVSTLKNLAYASVKFGAIDKALQYYKNLFNLIRLKQDKYDLRLTDTLRKKAYCEIKLFEYNEALHTLEKIETILEHNLDQIHDERLDEIEQLIDTVRAHIYKFRGISASMSKAMTRSGYRNMWDNELLCKCGYDVDNDEEIPLMLIMPKAPQAKTKMSGHRISFA